MEGRIQLTYFDKFNLVGGGSIREEAGAGEAGAEWRDAGMEAGARWVPSEAGGVFF